MKEGLFNRIFYYEKLVKQREKAITNKHQIVITILFDLLQCERINDLLQLHKRLDAKGYHVDIMLQDQHNGYVNIPVQKASVEHYWCGDYDHDGTYHGWDMLEFENNKVYSDYNFYSYCRAWEVYFDAIYKAVTNMKCPKVKFPIWLTNMPHY